MLTQQNTKQSLLNSISESAVHALLRDKRYTVSQGGDKVIFAFNASDVLLPASKPSTSSPLKDTKPQPTGKPSGSGSQYTIKVFRRDTDADKLLWVTDVSTFPISLVNYMDAISSRFPNNCIVGKLYNFDELVDEVILLPDGPLDTSPTIKGTKLDQARLTWDGKHLALTALTKVYTANANKWKKNFAKYGVTYKLESNVTPKGNPVVVLHFDNMTDECYEILAGFYGKNVPATNPLSIKEEDHITSSEQQDTLSDTLSTPEDTQDAVQVDSVVHEVQQVVDTIEVGSVNIDYSLLKGIEVKESEEITEEVSEEKEKQYTAQELKDIINSQRKGMRNKWMKYAKKHQLGPVTTRTTVDQLIEIFVAALLNGDIDHVPGVELF